MIRQSGSAVESTQKGLFVRRLEKVRVTLARLGLRGCILRGMSALFTLRVSVPGQCDPPGSTGERGDADVGRGGDARSRPGLEDRPGAPRWETLEFRAGNPRAEIITGRIRLYRDAIRASVASASPSATTTSAPATSLPEGRSPMVCVSSRTRSCACPCGAHRALRRRLLPVRGCDHKQGDRDAHRAGGTEGDTNRHGR